MSSTPCQLGRITNESTPFWLSRQLTPYSPSTKLTNVIDISSAKSSSRAKPREEPISYLWFAAGSLGLCYVVRKLYRAHRLVNNILADQHRDRPPSRLDTARRLKQPRWKT